MSIPAAVKSAPPVIPGTADPFMGTRAGLDQCMIGSRLLPGLPPDSPRKEKGAIYGNQ